MTRHFVDFSKLLPAHRVLQDEADCLAYGSDWCKKYTGKAGLVLLPETTEEVQAIVGLARQNKLALIPSGGRTGLSGGACALHGEVVVSLERMRKIFHLDMAEQTLHCQAGVVTAILQEKAKAAGLYFPIDLASAGSSQIGGNISTNAGGIHVIRYGATRSWVLGLQVVTGSGEILECNGKLVKNQTGYDFRSLFIGAEGTLGIVTECIVKLTRRPQAFPRIFCAIANIEHALRILEFARKKTSRVSAFEFFTHICLDYVLRHHPFRRPFTGLHPYYCILEVEDMTREERQDFEEFFAEALEKGWVEDVLFSESQQQADDFMNIRERIGETTASHYSVQKNDISVPVSAMPEFLKELQERSAKIFPDCDILLFGHVGDGNIHLNIVNKGSRSQDEFFKLCEEREDAIFELIAKHKGSVSAEHGIGLLKKPYLHYTRSQADIAFMRGVKQVFDPDGVMNPGKIY